MTKTMIVYKEFYNRGRGLPEPVWGEKAPRFRGRLFQWFRGRLFQWFRGRLLQCPTCGSTDMYYSGSLDDPEEVFSSTVRCKHCGHITDWYEAYQQRVFHPADKPMEVIHENPTCSDQGHIFG